MRKIISLAALFFFILSCDRYPDPSFEYLKQYSFSFQENSNQKFFAGEWVDDSIRFFAVDNKSPFTESVDVVFEVIKGGGEVTTISTYTDKNGNAFTGWKLGTESSEQMLRASTYDLAGNYLSSTDLIEYGFRNDVWNEYSGYPDANMMGMATDTVNGITLMVAGNILYRQGDRYYQWEEIYSPHIVSPRTINIDENGVFYVSTWNGELIKSTDHGETWIPCTKPYSDRPNFFYIYVANDNWIWAYYFDYPTKFSKDGGNTWTEAGSNLSSAGYGDVFRLKDGSLLFHGSNCCSLNRSFDNGLTWHKIETPGYSVKLYVNENDEIYICTQENGITIYKSVDYGESFIKAYGVFPQWGTSMENTFNKWRNNYYILIPGWGILKTPDLKHFEEYWYNANLRDLFIDHNGVLIAKDWNWNTVYYRKNSE